MGKLIEQPITTLFQGVSRQPDTVRLPGQVQEADNALFSVVTGGFEKRAGTKHVAKLTAVGGATNVAVYGYERDANEQYIIIVKDDASLLVYDLAGNAKTVNVPDTLRYWNRDSDSTQTVTNAAIHIAYPASETQIDLTTTGFAGGLTVVVEGSTTGAFAGEETTLATFTTNTTQTVTIKPYIRTKVTVAGTGTFSLTGTFKDLTYLLSSDPENGFTFATVADYTLIANKTVTVQMEPAGTGTVNGKVQTFGDLPTTPADGDIYEVTGKDTDNFTGYYVVWTAADSVWTETAKPDIANTFDAATMPHQLVREADGTFTFQRATWNAREVGDDVLVPNPDFVGKKVVEMVFHRNRISFVAEETSFASQSGDYFNFWPDKATDVLDSDPFGRTAASGQSVNNLKFALSFARALWLTSEKAQFSITSLDSLTPRTAEIDQITAYTLASAAHPIALGNAIYFAGEEGTAATVHEYILDPDNPDNVADNVMKHAGGYVPSPIVLFAGETITDTLVCVSDAERHRAYVYRFFWNNDEKAMSSWCRWTFGDNENEAYINGIQTLDGKLYLVVKRGADTYLESLLTSNEFDDTTSDFVIADALSGRYWPIRLDRRVALTGTYNAGTDKTSWTLPYPHNSEAQGVLGGVFSNKGRLLSLTYSGTDVVTADGDLTAGPVIFGFSYLLYVEFSKQYVRDGAQNNRSITSGRLQLRRMQFDYQDTGYFEVVVTPRFRSAKTYKFTGRVLGALDNLIGVQPFVERGTFRCRVGSRADEVTIAVQNNTHVPCTITSAAWKGFFNEITRQEP